MIREHAPHRRLRRSWQELRQSQDVSFQSGKENLIKLYFSRNSPYARRARLAVREGGLMDQVEEIAVESLEQLSDISVGQKIPVLVCEDGTELCESLIITRYLNDLAGGILMPGEKADLLQALQLESVASVLMDSHFVRSMEKYRREEALRSTAVINREQTRANRCYRRLDALVTDEADRVTLAAIAVISALDYANWRHPEDDWRTGNHCLSAYYDRLSVRPAFAGTAPAY
ncbi:MAG: glutathione S-transferase family protein [Pseudomonadales bacterium]